MDRIKEMMDSLSELDDSQVAELQKSIVSEFESVEGEEPTPQTVDAMTSLADMLDSVRTELKTREAAIQELAQRAAEAATRVHGADGEAKEDGSEDSSETPEEMPAEEEKMPMAETAEMPVEDKKEDAPAETPMVEETPVAEAAPAAEAPVSSEEIPAEEKSKEEDDKEEEEKKTMSEASTEAVEAAELSTETTETAEAPVAEAPVLASAEDEAAPAAEAAAEEVTTEVAAAEEAEAVVADEAAEDSAVAEDDAAADVAEDAEASNKETTTIELSTTEAQETMEAPVTAAANADLTPEVPADRRPVTQVSAAPVAITAGADIPGYSAGSALEDMNSVASAMEKRIHALRRVNGGDGEQHIVASVTTSFSEDRTLTTDAESNWAKIQNVVSPEAIVAAGGHVAPFEARYDIFGFGTTGRPVRDALPRFQADRGGIRFITPPVLSDYADAVGVWTAANDAATTPSPAAKASLTVTAAGENTVATEIGRASCRER